MTDGAIDLNRWQGGKIPAEFELAHDDIHAMITGDTIRLCHLTTTDGVPCSLNKDNAMTVTRYAGGWWWKCFRCEESGFVHADCISPAENLKQLVEPPKETYKQEEHECGLPFDAVKMSDETMKYNDLAWNWLWKYSINDEMVEAYDIRWSSAYKRIIFPVWEMAVSNQGAVGKRQIGWVGRCPQNMEKSVRQKEKRPKWLTKKAKAVKAPRFYAYVNSSDYICIVEDVVSAIRVADGAKINTIALLNKNISKELIQSLRGLTCILWLDKDADSDALDYMQRMNTLGIKTRMISTYKDPKELHADHIKKLIDRRRKGYGY